MKRILFAVTLCASPAFAQDLEVFVVQGEGQGVVQWETNTTLEEAEVLVNGPRPSGATRIILEKDRSAKWTNLSPEEINETYGGEGLPYIEDRKGEVSSEKEDESLIVADTNTNTSSVSAGGASAGGTSTGAATDEASKSEEKPSDTESDEDEEKRNEEQAETATDGRIKPLAGTWIGKIRDQTFEGCPTGIAEAVSAQSSPLDTSEILGAITPSFDPSVSMPQLDWEKTGPNSWLADFDQTQGGVGMRIQWAVRIKNPSLITNRQQMEFVGPMMSGCKIYTEVDYVRTD